MKSSEANSVVNLWFEIFKNEDAEVVKLAVINLIQSLEFPPTIADVRKEIAKIVDAATNEPTAIDEWNMIRKSISDSLYNAEKHFEELPSIAKKFVGGPLQLRAWGASTDFNEGVVRGQFLKQYDILKEREKNNAILDKIGFKLTEGQNIKLVEGAYEK